jgi:hypothetical protein
MTKITDPIEIAESLLEVVNHIWKDEMRHFEETFDVEIQSQDDLDEWIKTCKSKKMKV